MRYLSGNPRRRNEGGKGLPFSCRRFGRRDGWKGMRPPRRLRNALLAIAAGATFGTLSAAGSAAAAGTHTVCPVGCNFMSIQAAIDDAGTTAGDTISVGAGTYTENVNVTKAVTIAGAGAGATTVQPAAYGPTCTAGSGSLCSGGPLPSVVFLVAADNVTISKLTINGNNPALNGPDGPIDARDGIETNFLVGVFNNLTVRSTAVRNLYLRGIFAASGGTFTIDGNVVQNVRSDPNGASIAIFNREGSGSMTNNDVSFAGDAISSNFSTGVTMTGNTISHSGSGLHTDNPGNGGGSADLIANNTVTDCDLDGYGVFVFVPYIAPTVRNNTVSGCAVGMAAFGGAFAPSPTVTPILHNNSVDGTGASVSSGGSVGVFLTTDTLGFGQTDNSVELPSNTIRRFATGIKTEELGGKDLSVDASFNRIAGNNAGLVGGAGTSSGFENNWWGCNTGPNTPGCDTTVGNVDSDPWLQLRVSADPPAGCQTDRITADLLRNSDGNAPAPNLFPDGTPISFATTSGSIETPKGTAGAVAQTTLTTAAQPVDATVSATLDNQTVSSSATFVCPPPPPPPPPPPTCDTTIEAPVVSARKVQRQRGTKIKVRIRVGAAESIVANVGGKVKVGKKSYKLTDKSAAVAPRVDLGPAQRNGVATLTLRPIKKGARSKIAAALAQRKKVRALLSGTLTASDCTSTSFTKTVKIRLKAKK